MSSSPPGSVSARTVSVVLPVFSETDSVGDVCREIARHLGDDLLEILVVLSPRSPEETRSACAALAERDSRILLSTQTKSPGVGYAFRDGIALARGARILLIDSDGEMDPGTVPALVAKMDATGAHMVLGSRWAKGGGAEGYEPLKYVLNRGYQLIFRALYRTRVHDLTFGYKLADAAKLKALPLEAQFQEIGCEVTLRALKAGWRVEEVPTVWRRRKAGVSTNPLSRNLKYARLALEILTGSGPAHGAPAAKLAERPVTR